MDANFKISLGSIISRIALLEIITEAILVNSELFKKDVNAESGSKRYGFL
jgi:hypothetical protein